MLHLLRNLSRHFNTPMEEFDAPRRPCVDHLSKVAVDEQSTVAGGGSSPGLSTELSRIPAIISEQSSVNCGIGDAQKREARDGGGNQGAGDGVHISAVHFSGSGHAFGNNSTINNTLMIRSDGEFTDAQKKLISDYVVDLAVLPDININLKKHVLTQSIITLPRAEAVFDDYQNKKKSGPCLKGTREALLREMMEWVTGSSESRMYVLSGLAGMGKSTIAYTIAARTADLGLLSASFFFSREEADRKSAKRFFTTIAYQLCRYDETFSKAIGDALLTERGSAAITKDPEEQLHALIMDPLQNIVQSRVRPVLVVIDALDECDEDDTSIVVTGLSKLTRFLPSFKIILTTRPHLVKHLFDNHDGHNIFQLQDIEAKVVDSDICLYLSHSLSRGQVRASLRNPNEQWCASDEEISFLVKAAGRLFIIASTTVRLILDKVASNPAVQMRKLLHAYSQYRMPFKDLDWFYTVIIRNAVPVDCDDDIVNRYQSVLGTILTIKYPLPVATLARLIDKEEKDIRTVLNSLQSVILLSNDDIPRIYHKSFLDHITDPTSCQDISFYIDKQFHHTQIMTRCFDVMDEHLKYNILGLGDPARFMDNKDGLRQDKITDEKMFEKVPPQLRYACVFWANHFEVANLEGVEHMNRLTKFMDEHLLPWFEVLSLIRELNSAHIAIRIVLKHLKMMSSELHQLLCDALRFISKFYRVINRSALHTYYSALPFTPTDSLLYRRYIKKVLHNMWGVDGGPKKWDAYVADMSHGERVDLIKFSLDSTLFISFSKESVDYPPRKGILKFWDAATGTPINTILRPGHQLAISNDFSTIGTFKDKNIAFLDIKENAWRTISTASSEIKELAISSESSRIAAALSNGTVLLWDSRNLKLINSFDGHRSNVYSYQLVFSSSGTRLAYPSENGVVKLLDGICGRFIANLKSGSNDHFRYIFSSDGSRIASLSSRHGLMLWNSEDGALITTVKQDAYCSLLAISTNGSLLATASRKIVNLRSGNGKDSKYPIRVLRSSDGHSDALSIIFALDHILAIEKSNGTVKLYNVKTNSVISMVSVNKHYHTALALSPDCTRLVTGNSDGTLCLWDVRDSESSNPPLDEQANRVTSMALSPDCSRLTCGFGNGKVELWQTIPTKRRIATWTELVLGFGPFWRGHTKPVTALGFSPDGSLFASGSHDRYIKLWNSGDGKLRETLKVPSHLNAMAISNSVLVAASFRGVTLWDLHTLSLINTFDIDTGFPVSAASITENHTLAAFCCQDYNPGATKPCHIVLFDVVNCAIIDTFDISYRSHITMTNFLPDNSQLIAQDKDGDFLSVNLINKQVKEAPILEHIVQLPNFPLWHGVPIWYDKKQHCLVALFSQHKTPIPVLWIPMDLRVEDWTQGSSMIALACEGGRVILLRLQTSNAE